MWLSLSYTEKNGPFSTHMRTKQNTFDSPSNTTSTDYPRAHPLNDLEQQSRPTGANDEHPLTAGEYNAVTEACRPDGMFRPPMEAGAGGVYAGT